MDTNILIIDDDAAIRNGLHKFIMASGYTPFKASSSEEGLGILKAHKIHVVITDIILPGIDGLELTELIKKTYEDTDVIVMTGFSGNYSYKEAITKGASDLVFKPVRFEELLLRLKKVLKGRRLTNERNEMMAKLKELGITDGLTKLYNSRHFYSQMEIEIGRADRYNHPLTLLLLDIDLFKNYNDQFGHLEGDKVLHRTGKIIKSCLRRMDTAYRYGGEEFTILLPETPTEEAMTVAERIRSRIEKETFSPQEGKKVSITISIGVTEYCKDEDLSVFVRRADRAMYLSKKNGRNRVSTLFSGKEVKKSALSFSY
jgi:diguanylate cyclase (GGDEF)-like protein